MGKISSYTSVTTQSTDDLLICDQDVGGTLTTMKTTVGKVGTAVAEVQTHAALDTTNKTIVGAINEVGSLPDTATGTIATFTTSLEKPLVACECEIVAQGGGGTPDSPISIVGYTGMNVTRCGANLWDNQWETGTYNVNGVKANWSGAIRSKNYIDVEPSTDYCILFGTTSSMMIFWYKSDNTFINYVTINENGVVTAPANAYKATFSTWNDYGSTYNNDLSFNANPTVYPITWQTEAGTIYGGSLNVTSGVLTVTYYKMKLNDCTPVYNSTNGFFGYYNSSSTPSAVLPTQRKTAGGILCECYAVYPNAISSVSQIPSLPDKTIYYQGNNGNFYVKDTDYTDSTTFLNNIGTKELVYEMLTPTTYQLTPTEIETLVGTNNVFNDTNGNTSVTYLETIKEYIDKRVTP